MVRKPSGKPKGELSFSYKVGEKSVGVGKVDEPVTAYPSGKPNKVEEPVTTYPAGKFDKLDEPVTAYPALVAGSSSMYPLPNQYVSAMVVFISFNEFFKYNSVKCCWAIQMCGSGETSDVNLSDSKVFLLMEPFKCKQTAPNSAVIFYMFNALVILL
ncbi:hypothetical protein L1887_36364 [Cichorium endivia]|nr:hypothetical protein L1887_36364 [Cichorium endivia]